MITFVYISTDRNYRAPCLGIAGQVSGVRQTIGSTLDVQENIIVGIIDTRKGITLDDMVARRIFRFPGYS